MPTRSKVVKQTHGAWLRADVTAFDEELCRTGRGTPCGEYLRRFWQPVVIAAELGKLPRAIRILGEDLVVFRDGSGNHGLLERRCVHRGTSLEYGKVVERGIRCCYHGWQFDVDGRILDTPGEPAGSNVRHRICQGAYPLREWRGLLFAYMGPPGEQPPFPEFDAFERPQSQGRLWTRESPCNWLQVRENEMDPIHLTFLHTRLFGVQFTPVYGDIPSMEWMETGHGLVYATVRRQGENLYLRTNDMILPNVVRVAGIDDGEGETLFDRRGSSLNWVVPVDDTHSMTIGWSDIDKDHAVPGNNAYIDRQLASGAYAVGAADVGQTGEPSYEQRQRAPGDWDAWVSQGAITVHGREHLATTDRGVTLYRKLLRRSVRALARGRRPKELDIGDDGPVFTMCHNTVARLPPRNDPAEEQALRIAFGREVTDRLLAGEFTKQPAGCAEPTAIADIVRATHARTARSEPVTTTVDAARAARPGTR